ncbi:hypothetical protein DPMN_006428 [Dreissena polymorpha]|uniref:Uncharacterized protein n=1 Tax=Dreissena polymorpha TaxID=45954 RepID=A0A9D4MU46_DREPO|nr:hypothetical protein DPMN_006428 [Dreissena polymorpha]
MLTLVSKRQDQLEEEVKKVNCVLKDVNGKLSNQVSEISIVMKDVAEMKLKLPEVISEKVSEVLLDKRKDELRANNMIFFNLKEAENGSSKERDIELLGEVISSIGVDLDPSQLENVTRLGRLFPNSTKIRPIRLSIESRIKRGEILRNAYKLKDISRLSKVGIGRDLTQKQRENNIILKKTLEATKKDFPGKIWAIRRDKIVELQPRQAINLPAGATGTTLPAPQGLGDGH